MIHRTLSGERHCTAEGCLLEWFIQSARGQLERYHANAFQFLARVVSDPMDVAVIAAGDLLDAKGALRDKEIRDFIGLDVCDDAVHNGNQRQRWERYVSVRLKRTLSDMREAADPWTRKIRSCVENAVSESNNIIRIPEWQPALYYRPEVGDPRLEAEPIAMEEILLGLFERKDQWESVSSLIMTVFDILAMRPRCRQVLTAAELTRIVVDYHITLLSIESDVHIDEETAELDDRDRQVIDYGVRFLRDGRLVHYQHQGIYSEAECEKLALMARDYLDDLWHRRTRSLTEYLQEVFPSDAQRSQDPEERKRASNLILLARKAAFMAWCSG